MNVDRLDDSLPFDVSRCVGYMRDIGQLAPDCERCMRRLDRSAELLVWMAPPIELDRGEPCPMRIGR